MKVFLTGGMGFIGSHLVVELLNQGDEVTILARDPNKVPGLLAMTGVSVVRGSLDDHNAIRAALPGHDACIHNALYWEDEPTELQLKDTRASVNLFESAAEAEVKNLIYTSSTGVHRPFRPVMDEQMRLTPTDYYGATKAASEVFLSAFSHQTYMRCNIIRPGPTLGKPAMPGAPVQTYRRLQSLVEAALKGIQIDVPENDSRQFIGAPDLARLYSAVLHSNANRETYLCVAQNLTSLEEIAHEVVALSGSKSQITVSDHGNPETPNRFDVTKIQREFGLVFDSRPALQDHIRYLLR